jgi:hypothetical protein
MKHDRISEPAEIHIHFERGDRLPVGTLSNDVSGETLQFAGWLELIAALEAARIVITDPGLPPSRLRARQRVVRGG